MQNIFISYSRVDAEAVKSLVEDIEVLGFSVWYDQELSGGQMWWDQILESIRKADIFLFVLSPKSLRSTACSREVKYASALGKTILPILAADGVSTNLLPPELSKYQFVDYRTPSRESALKLARALRSFTDAPPLPDPLPEPPELPVSYLGSLTEKINSRDNLSFEDQSALLLDLKQALTEEDNRKDAVTVLTRMRKRRDLFAHIGDQIDELLKSTATENPISQRQPQKEETYQPVSQRLSEKSKEQEDQFVAPVKTSQRDRNQREPQRRRQRARHEQMGDQGGRFSTLAMVLMIIGSIFIPLIGIIAGIYAMMKHERKDQAYTLLIVSGIMFFINLLYWAGGGMY